MSHRSFTRRCFVAAGAAATLAVGCGPMAGCSQREEALARHTTTAPVYFGAGPYASGATAFVVDGKLTNIIGTAGNLPAGAYGCCQRAYEDNRVSTPLRRSEDGTYQAISWDEALGEIAETITALDPRAVAIVCGAGPTERFYGKELARALGANAYVTSEVYSLAQMEGTRRAVGASLLEPDLAQCDAALIIGSLCDDVIPAHLAALAEARDNGAYVAFADSRLTADGRLASEWLPIAPGTGLALLLGIARYLIDRGAYDAAYVEAHTQGFDQWKSSLAGYTTIMAARDCGLPVDAVEGIAAKLAASAPRASVSCAPEMGGDLGYGNSGEMARAACLVNTLLGCWNQPGGAYICNEPLRSGAENASAPETTTVEAPAASAVKAIEDGTIQALILLNADGASLGFDNAQIASALDGLSLMVAVDSVAGVATSRADYVLPTLTAYEAVQIPALALGRQPVAYWGAQVIPPVVDQALPLDSIAGNIAAACQRQGACAWRAQEDAALLLAPSGLSAEGLAKAGSAPLSTACDGLESFGTASGKIEFASALCEQDGLSPVPAWTAPEMQAAHGDKLLLLTGSVGPQASGATASPAPLSDIASAYELQCAWINDKTAHDLGLSTGDMVEVSNELGSFVVPVKATARIVPSCVFVPQGLPVSESEHRAVSPRALLEHRIERGYGTGAPQGSAVSVIKVGA